jgi:hypothetical protein
MKTGGWIFMLLAWGTIISIAVWCVKKLVFDGKRDQRPKRDPGTNEGDGRGGACGPGPND